MDLLAGIFVGGRASRMHGVAKGLLPTEDGEPIVLRTRRLLEAIGATCFLVGEHPAYAELGIPRLPDAPAASGPLAGILALLAATEGRAIAVACDMPFVTPALLERLVTAPAAPIVAPRRPKPDGVLVWEPLFARYDASVLPIARAFAAEGERKLQRLLDRAGAQPLALDPADEHALTDWDTPEDLPAGRRP